VLASRDTVVVAGKSSALTYLTSLDVPASAVKVDGADQNVTMEIDLTRYLPDGIVLADAENDKMVSVEVPIDEILTKEFEISTDAVVMNGLPGDLEAKILDSDDIITIRVEGFSQQMNVMQASDVKIEIDWEAYRVENELEKLKEGRCRVPAQITVPEGVTKVASEITVLVELVEK